MRTTHSQYKETKRKVNDLWALALYVVFMAGVIAYMAFMSKTKSYLDLASHFDMKVLIFTFVCGFLSFGVHLAALLYFPGPAMHLSCVVIPVLSVIFAVLSGNIVGIVLSVIFSALMLVTYLFYLRKHIKYAAQIAKSAAQLVCTNIFSTLCVLILFLTGWSGMFYFFVTVSTGLTRQDRIIGLAIEFLAVAWTLFIFYYSLRVFIASIFVVHYLMRSISPTQRAAEAFKNWLYALGSICFGALIIAIITVLRMLVDRERDRSGSVGSFFYSILLVLLDILQDLVNFSNEWAYCYVALTGKGYVESSKESWRFFSRPENYALTNSLPIRMLLALLSLLFFLVYTFGLSIIVDTKDSPLRNIKLPAYIFLACSYFFFGYGVSTVFDSGVKSIFFTYSMFPGDVKMCDSKLADMIEEQRKTVY